MIAERGIDLAKVYQKLPIALCIVGRDGCLLAVNDLHAQLAGRPIDDLIGVRVAELSTEGGKNVERDFRVFDAGGAVPNHEMEARGRWYMVSVSPVMDHEGTIAAISVAHFDITEKKAAEQKIARMNRRLADLSNLDHLTKVGNRRQFDQAFAAHCSTLRRNGRDFSFILLDVDYFKAFNDHYGHQEGDRCLQAIADCTKRTLRSSDAALYRYGGEEFAVVTDQSDPANALAIARRICTAVRQQEIPHEQSQWSIVTVSCGVTSTQQLPRPLPMPMEHQIIASADEALYQAKAEGRNMAMPFNPLRSIYEGQSNQLRSAST